MGIRPHRPLPARLRSQAGLTMVETMVAMVVLLSGLLGTFLLVDIANGQSSKSKAREAATNVARELLEEARDTNYQKIGESQSWFQSTLDSLPGKQGSVSAPNSYSQQVTVSRRGVSYVAGVSWCSVDDARDGHGSHSASIRWCSDSSTTGASDTGPEDLKRVTVTMSYSVGGTQQPNLVQTATFSSSGTVVGPEVTGLEIIAPPSLTGSPPTVTSAATTTVTFRATSVGAADMKFTVNGVEQTSGVTSNGNGSWDFAWPISSLKDATYTIGAIAVDALGTRGQPRTMQVKLNRGAPVGPQNVTGGYNYTNPPGQAPPTGTQVVELEWDANPEGSVTGYSVEKSGSTVTGCGQSFSTSCIDNSPASSGSTTYTVKTHYTDGAGAAQFVSTTYAVTAPGAGGSVPTKYWPILALPAATPHCYTGFGIVDLTSTAPTASTDTTFSGQVRMGCTAPVPAGTTLGAGNGTLEVWLSNTNNKSCTSSASLYHNSSSTAIGTQIAGPLTYTVPAGTTTPTKYTINFSVPAKTLVTDDQLQLQINVATASGACSKMVLYHGSTIHPTNISLPTLTGGGGGSTLDEPEPPTGLTVTANGDGTRTLTWSAPASSTPAVEFYRIYRDGQAIADRVDTLGATGSSLTWTDTNTGGSSHTYRVTSAAATLTESDVLGPVTG